MGDTHMARMAKKSCGWVLGLALALGVSAGPAWAYNVDGNWVASDYATGFPTPASAEEAGPLGLAFDGAGNLFVTDIGTGSLHRVPPGGGNAADTLVAAGLGKAAGLAFGADGRLYMARADQARVDEINPGNGTVVRTVVSGLPCPTALATDPISEDLFASNKCNGGTTVRISNPTAAKPTAKTYANQRDDGLTFAPDGTLFAAAEDTRIDSIAGTASSSPGQATKLADVDEADGIAYAPATQTHDAYLVVNRNSGEIDMLDFAGNLTPIVTGASRGDLVTVGPDHCVYAALADRVIKLAPSQGSCNFATPVQPASQSQPGGGSPNGQAVLGERQSSPVVDTAIKTKAPRSVKKGKRFTVTLKVTNRSRSAAHSVAVTYKLPKGAKLVKAKGCKARKGVLTCKKASLAARKSFTLRVLLLARSGKSYTSTAKVQSKDLDPAPGNNSSKAKTKVKRR